MYRIQKPDSVKEYLFNVTVAFDILLNCLLAGKVRTMSERIGEKKLKPNWSLKKYPLHWIVDTYILEPIDPGHSIDAYRANKECTHLEDEK